MLYLYFLSCYSILNNKKEVESIWSKDLVHKEFVVIESHTTDTY